MDQTNIASAIIETILATIFAPRIGTLWVEHGGIYAGIVRGIDGASDYHLILLTDTTDELHWDGAMAWAKSINGDLPTRSEQAILYGNLKNEFEREWYWSNTQHADDSDYAWMQDFGYGYQGGNLMSNECRARAVRRLSIIQ
ncbi:MAG: hypothetical protein ACEQSE_09295 [Candidatus Aquirickettsiella gammari]